MFKMGDNTLWYQLVMFTAVLIDWLKMRIYLHLPVDYRIYLDDKAPERLDKNGSTNNVWRPHTGIKWIATYTNICYKCSVYDMTVKHNVKTKNSIVTTINKWIHILLDFFYIFALDFLSDWLLTTELEKHWLTYL